MKKIIITTLAILVSQMGFAQVSLDGNKLLKDGQSYKFKEYEQVFNNAEAKVYFKKARTNKTVGDIISFTGGFGLGLGLAGVLFTPQYSTEKISGQKFKNDKGGYWTMLGIGAGLVGVSIPFYVGYGKNASKAVAIENGTEPVSFKPYFKVESNGSNIALSYNF
ncbi:hypothetical protein [Bergeyella zoohelcum]|uniref:Uncharacterized protein n=1 Tax=Bergeyella zoohelcum TaxID=1015 RepID=A0A376C0X8_9FLAO|nr:hypothetical protein [Bergeyella zoohelcum]EKB61018.1 hypothetical protein HMPREF9700_00513 [Bergeyella zoohelcum CCUG 30536]SSZ46890.1 Uncharacterised protein [Bergeyella zoohelcum]